MTPAFTVSQSTINPSSFTLTDTSTSVTGTITQRRIFVSNANGEYLTGDGTVDWTAWPLAEASITLDILDEDTACNILVQWLNVSDVVVETLDNNYPLSEFGKQFFVYLIQTLGLNPSTYQDSNYSGNLALFWTYILAGDNAVSFGNNISAAQACYNLEINMKNNQNLFF